MSGAIVVARSQNGKTGPVAATYAGQHTCPVDCPLMDAGCYAEYGPTGIITRRLGQALEDPIDTAIAEAAAIAKLPGDRPLRVHVVGDCATAQAAQIVSQAMEAYPNVAWTYTHAWRDVDRRHWGKASVLASCETADDVRQAHARGYAACIVVDRHSGPQVYDMWGMQILPCPSQFGDVQCADCLLCSKEMATTIGFALHGTGRNRAYRALLRRRES